MNKSRATSGGRTKSARKEGALQVTLKIPVGQETEERENATSRRDGKIGDLFRVWNEKARKCWKGLQGLHRSHMTARMKNDNEMISKEVKIKARNITILCTSQYARIVGLRVIVYLWFFAIKESIKTPF